jgi:hypothetical protein
VGSRPTSRATCTPSSRLRFFELLFGEAMPIRDAVDLARFLIETTIGFVKFSIARPKTVGGAIAIVAITKHEGFQWVQRLKEFDASCIQLTSTKQLPAARLCPARHLSREPEPSSVQADKLS